jgi:TorA maturation chaperone TorD
MSPVNEQISALVAGIKILSELFWGPNLQKCREIVAGTYFQPFTALKNVLNFEPPDVLQRIESGLKNFSDADSLFQYLEPQYVRLFISHRYGIAAPLYESCYAGVEPGETASLMGAPAIMMNKRLQSSGLSIGDSISEPSDHISIELEYLYYLLERGWAEGRPALFNEAVSFAANTMLPWVSMFRERLAGESECRFYFFIASIVTAGLGFISEFDPMGSPIES